MTPAVQSALAGLPAAFTPSTTAVGGNVYLTAAVGLLPLVVFFVLMGVFKVATHWCAIISLVIAAITAITLFHMPVGMTVMSATQGMALGFVPIIYIIIAAVWLYNLTDVSGRSKDLKAVFNVIGKGDMRAQALIVAFSFCGLLEGLAGFGAPVAIAAAMVATLGLPKLKAAVVVMVGNAINVGFGAMAIPTTTAGKLGGEDPVTVATAMGHLTWVFCAFIPLLLLFILDGARGVKQLWPLAIVAGLATGVGHFFTPSISYELTAVLASLLGLAASYILLLVWTPTTPEEYRSQVAADDAPDRERVILALLPYVLVVVIIATTKLWTLGINLDKAFKATDLKIKWPGVYGQLLNAKGEASTGAIYNHFGSKEGLFDALVGESAERLVSAWAAGRTGSDSGGPDPATGPGGGRGETAPGSDGGAADSEALAHSVGRTNDLLALIYDDLDIFELLLCHATGSRYEHFPEQLVRIEEEAYRSLPGLTDSPADRLFAHSLASNGLEALRAAVDHGLTRQEARQYMDRVTRFRLSGWAGLLAQSPSARPAPGTSPDDPRTGERS